MQEKKQIVILILVSLYLLFFLNSQLPVTDTVESNYALTAKEMVQTGDWVSPQIYGNYWYDKPVFFYWQTASAYKILGFTEFASRFWPSIMGVLSVMLLYWFGSKTYSPKTGLISALLLVSSLEFWLIAKSVITDMTLFFFFNAALACFYLAYNGKEKNYYYFFYLFCGLATLTKGPIGFLLPGLVVTIFLLWTRNWSELKQMKIGLGALLFSLVTVPWYYLMYLRHGQEYLNVFFGVHNFLRATVSEHPNNNVFYYYLLILIIGFFPWVAFLPQLCRNIWHQVKSREKISQNNVFLIIWVVVVSAFFQLIATKYPTYTFPTLLPLALLTGKFLVEKEKKIKFFWPLIYIAFFSLCLIAGGALFLRPYHFSFWNYLPALLTVVVGVSFSFYLSKRKKNKQIVVALLITIFLFNTFIIQSIFVPVTHYRSAKAVALAVKSKWEPGTTVGCYGDYSTSAVFYSDQRIFRLVRQSEIAKLKPAANSWTSKNVMPFFPLEDLKDKQKVLIIVEDESYQDFIKENIGSWKVVKHLDGQYLLEKTS